MVDTWHYVRGGRRHGPLSFGQIRQLAADGQLGPADMVQDSTAGRWVAASAVPELGFPVPGRARHSAPPGTRGSVDAAAAWERLRAVARAQRVLNLTAGVALGGLAAAVAGSQLLAAWRGGGVAVAVLIAAGLAYGVGLPVGMARLAAALDLSFGGWLVRGLIPVVNLFALADLSRRANGELAAAGVRVGFLGATPPDRPPAGFVAPRRVPAFRRRPPTPAVEASDMAVLAFVLLVVLAVGRLIVVNSWPAQSAGAAATVPGGADR